MDILNKFYIIKNYFEKKDIEQLKKGITPVHKTGFGLWGAASMMDVFEFFSKIELERFNNFADYGSGDGRIVFVASLFTKAIGVEGDKELYSIAIKAKKELIEQNPELSSELKNTIFKCKNYYEEKHEDYDIIFFFPDHPFPRTFEKKIKDKFRGYLIIYNNIHLPYGLKKGKTYWIQQLPIVTYPVNVDKEDLFARTNKNKDDPAIK